MIGTLIVHGLTLPRLVALLGLPGRDVRAETLAEAQAQSEASRRALERFGELLREEGDPLPPPMEERLRNALERRQNAVWERLGAVTPTRGESVDAVYRRLLKETLAAERGVFVRMRDERRIDDEMLRTLMRRLDLVEAWAEVGAQE